MSEQSSAAKDFDDPTKRVEATTTPEGAKGWADRGRLGTDSPAGGHGLNVAPDASPEGVRAETRPREDRAGGEPSNAPTAGNAAWRRRTEWPRWACVLVDDGWTDSLFERVVATVVIWAFLLAPVALIVGLVAR